MIQPASAANYIQLLLTCGSWQEAQRIVDHLLEQHLIACAEFIPIKSRFQWKDKIEQNDEIKLIMQTIDQHFERIEAEVSKLHSYETFVLQAVPVTQLSADARHWLEAAVRQVY